MKYTLWLDFEDTTTPTREETGLQAPYEEPQISLYVLALGKVRQIVAREYEDLGHATKELRRKEM